MAKKKTGKKKRAVKKPAETFDWITEDLRPLATPMERATVDPQNARGHGDENIAAIEASLAAYGQNQTIVVNRQTGLIVVGNGRYLAAQRLGWSHAAMVFVEQSEADHRGYAIADNRTAELAAWQFDVLEAQLAELQEDTPDLYDALLLDKLRRTDEPDAEDVANQPVPETYEVVIECADEPEQRATYEQFQKEGRKCRLLTC